MSFEERLSDWLYSGKALFDVLRVLDKLYSAIAGLFKSRKFLTYWLMIVGVAILIWLFYFYYSAFVWKVI